jgi:hypothetical protein
VPKAAAKPITKIAGKPVAKQPAKTDVHPKYGKKVTVDGKHVGYIKQGEYSAHQKGSVGNVSVGTKTGKKFEMFDADGNKLGTAYNQADAKYEVEKAAKQPAPKVTVKLPAAKPSSMKNAHGIDTSKIKMYDLVSDGYGNDVKVISVNDDGSVSGLKKNAFGDNVHTTIPADSVKYHSPPSATAPPPVKPAKPSTTNQHGIDTSKVKVGDEVLMDWGEKVTVTSTDLDDYGNMTGQSHLGETTINPKFFKVHKPGVPGAAAKVAKPKSVKVAKYEKPHIPHSNTAYDDHNFKLPGGYQYGSEGFREVPPGSSINLNYAERAAVAKYTGHEYDAINGQLRHGYGNSQTETINNLDRAFEKVPPLETGVRMRRLMGDTDQLFGPVGSKVGGTFSDKGYVSTTYYHNPEDAGSFSGSDISIDMPPGTRALAPNGVGAFQDSEGEVLLPRDTKFKVKGDFMDEYGKRHIHLEVMVND